MARQAAVKTAPAGPEKAPAKSKSGRVFDYSRYRLSIHGADDFARYLAHYPDSTGLMAYVYRLVPRIDLTLIQSDVTNIHETRDPAEMTPVFIESKFGRGKYMLKLTDANREKGQNEVAKTWFDLQDSEKPPVYDLRTLLLGHHDNTDEVNRLLGNGQLVRDAVSGAVRMRVSTDPPAGAAPAAPANGGASVHVHHDELIGRDVLGRVFEKLITQGQQSPADMVKTSMELAQMMNGGGNKQLDVNTLADLVAAKLGRPAEVSDPFATWERMERFLDKARPAAAAVVTTESNGAAAGSGILRDLADLMREVNQAAPMLMAAFQFVSARRPETVVQRRSARPAAPAAAPPAAGPVETVAPSPAAAAAADPMAGAAPGSEDMIEAVIHVAGLAVDAMGKGTTGWDFAAWLVAWHPGGADVFRFLEVQGTPGVMGLLGMNPQTTELMADPARHAQVEAWLDDFFDYDFDGSAVGDAAPEPAPAASAGPPAGGAAAPVAA